MFIVVLSVLFYYLSYSSSLPILTNLSLFSILFIITFVLFLSSFLTLSCFILSFLPFTLLSPLIPSSFLFFKPLFFFYHHFAFAQFVSLLSLFYLFISLLSLSLPPPFFLSCSFLPSFFFLSFIASFLPLIPLHFVNCHVCCFFHPSLSYFLSFSFCFPLLMSFFSFLITVLLFLPSPLPSISFIVTCPHLHLII